MKTSKLSWLEGQTKVDQWWNVSECGQLSVILHLMMVVYAMIEAIPKMPVCAHDVNEE